MQTFGNWNGGVAAAAAAAAVASVAFPPAFQFRLRLD